MSELEQLKKRIIDNKTLGVKTAYIHEDYAPAGDLMIDILTKSGEFVCRKTFSYRFKKQVWRIFQKGMEPKYMSEIKKG